MKAVIIHGQNHQGTTWKMTRAVLSHLPPETEVVDCYVNHIPMCTGCFACTMKGEEACPHRGQTGPVIEAVERADLIILESPVYCLEMTGQLKNFLDHMAYRWASHRPNPAMKEKLGLVVCSTAGAGATGTAKELSRHFFYWGVPKVYRFAERVGAGNHMEPSMKVQKCLEAKAKKLAARISRTRGKARRFPRQAIVFAVMRLMQQGNDWAPIDRQYWIDQGMLK